MQKFGSWVDCTGNKLPGEARALSNSLELPYCCPVSYSCLLGFLLILFSPHSFFLFVCFVLRKKKRAKALWLNTAVFLSSTSEVIAWENTKCDHGAPSTHKHPNLSSSETNSTDLNPSLLVLSPKEIERNPKSMPISSRQKINQWVPQSKCQMVSLSLSANRRIAKI